MEVGDRVSAVTVRGTTVRTAVLVTVPQDAVRVAVVEAATVVVVIVKVTDFAPAGTVTLAGTDAAADEL